MRTGGILAVGAFVLSFILGLISGSIFLLVVVRAVFFAALFFGIGFGMNFLAKKLLLDNAGGGQSGHTVDISVGDGVEAAGFERPEDMLGPPIRGPLEAAVDTTPDDGSIDDISMLFNGEGKAGAVSKTSGITETTPTGTDKVPSTSDDAVLDSGGLAQNTDYSYNKTGSVINPAGLESAPPKGVNPPKGANSLNEVNSSNEAKIDAPDDAGTDFSGFIPGIPGVVSAFTKSAGDGAVDESGGGESKITVGTVEMSVEKPKQEVDLGKYKDGKKMAGAIQTMLKKDKE